jgi:predicted nucleic acid-binding protein
VQRLRAAFGKEEIVVGDIVLLEILQGMSNDVRAVSMEKWLRSFEVMPMLNVNLAISAASHYRQLRQQGITVRKTADLVIGTFCIDHGWPLLHDDRDFEPMERYLGLLVVHA